MGPNNGVDSRQRMTFVRLLMRASALSLSVALATACNSAPSERAVPNEPSQASEPAGVYAALGASETAGLGTRSPEVEAWPQVLRADALPHYGIVNLGISGATVEDALTGQVPEARAADPDVVTVWLNVNDLLRGVPLNEYQRSLSELLAELQAIEPDQVLVANTPPIEDLPAFRECRAKTSDKSLLCLLFGKLPSRREIKAQVTRYNDVIERVVARAGATLVDLHAAGLAARRDGDESDLISADGFHPSPTGHRAIAEVFEDNLDL